MGRSTGVTYPIRNIKKVVITVSWEQEIFGLGSKHFDNVHEFADFLKQHPEMAAKVGYVAKKR